MSKLAVPLELKTAYQELHQKMKDLSSSLPEFFKHYKPEEVSPKVKQLCEENWNAEHYGKNDAGHFEGWPVMELFKQAIHLGYEWGKREKELEQIQKDLKDVGQKLDLFSFAANTDRTYNPIHMSNVHDDENGNLTFDYGTHTSTSKNTNTQDFMKAYVKWEKEMLKLLKEGKLKA